VEWLAPELCLKGFRRCQIDPCVFRHDEWDATIGIHTDDGVIEIAPDLTKQCIDLLGSLLLKVAGQLGLWADGSIAVPYLGRWRSRIGNVIFKRIDPTYAQESVKHLGLERAVPAKTPSSKQLAQATSKELFEGDRLTVFRHVTGKLMHVQEDLFHSQYVIKELAREIISPKSGVFESSPAPCAISTRS